MQWCGIKSRRSRRTTTTMTASAPASTSASALRLICRPAIGDGGAGHWIWPTNENKLTSQEGEGKGVGHTTTNRGSGIIRLENGNAILQHIFNFIFFYFFLRGLPLCCDFLATLAQLKQVVEESIKHIRLLHTLHKTLLYTIHSLLLDVKMRKVSFVILLVTFCYQ